LIFSPLLKGVPGHVKISLLGVPGHVNIPYLYLLRRIGLFSRTNVWEPVSLYDVWLILRVENETGGDHTSSIDVFRELLTVAFNKFNLLWN